MERKKDPAAVSLGRRGGKARLVKMTAAERRRVASLGAWARWHRKGARKK